MKKYLIRFALLVFVLSITACTEVDDDEEDVELHAFSTFVRDVFDEPANEEPVLVVEGVDFQFEDADLLETYSDLLSRD